MKTLRVGVYYSVYCFREDAERPCVLITIVSVKTLRVGMYHCLNEDIEGWCVLLFQ